MAGTSFSLWILSHSSLAAISCNVSFLLAFISIEFSFLHGSYFILPWILSHSPLAAISCNISFLLASISIKVFFLHGSYFIFPWILSHTPLAVISCNISFLLACISLKSSFLHGSYFILPLDFVLFLSGSYFMQYFIPPGIYFNSIFIPHGSYFILSWTSFRPAPTAQTSQARPCLRCWSQLAGGTPPGPPGTHA